MELELTRRPSLHSSSSPGTSSLLRCCSANRRSSAAMGCWHASILRTNCPWLELSPFGASGSTKVPSASNRA